MSKVQIVTDSLIDLPKDIIEKYKIIVIPLTIIFDGKEYVDGVDLSNKQFYEKLMISKELPKTSQIAPGNFIEVFKEILNEGKDILCINGSSKASGTYQSAMIAKETFKRDEINVFDTMALSLGGGLLVYEAAKMAEEGKSAKEIVKELNKIKDKVDHIFTVDTLENLKKGGRLNTMTATIGTMLNIKPILTVKDGLVEPLDKVRGSKKVINKMIDITKERGGNFENKTIGIAHANSIDILEELKEQVKEKLNPKQLIIAEIGCTIGTHAGQGTLAIFYMAE